MAVITISRQLGSGGAIIARLVAEELGFRVLGRDIIDAVAVRAGVSNEVVRSLDEQALDWVGGFIRSFGHSLQGQPITQESYAYIVSQVIRNAARSENLVVLGRGGQVILGQVPGTFHVHVVAPLPDRIANLKTYENVDNVTARQRIQESDAVRRRFVMLVGRHDWEDPLIYDLIVNTHRLRPERVAGLIVDAARRAGVLDRHYLV